jgi:hypothetical protein
VAEILPSEDGGRREVVARLSIKVYPKPIVDGFFQILPRSQIPLSCLDRCEPQQELNLPEAPPDSRDNFAQSSSSFLASGPHRTVVLRSYHPLRLRRARTCAT